MNDNYYDKPNGGTKNENKKCCAVNPFKKVQQYYHGLIKITILSCVTIIAVIAASLSVKPKN